MIERLVPDSGLVSVAWRPDLTSDDALFAEEARFVARAVEKRRREYATGRACARAALARLGVEPVAIGTGSRGEPLWPSGIRGSITHCDGYYAGAVARSRDIVTLGIDAEVHKPLSETVLERVAFGAERARVADPPGPVRLDTVLFSAKEAVYKAWFPVAQRWLGFEDVELTIDAEGTFLARLRVPGWRSGGVEVTALEGRWAVQDGIVATAVVVGHRRS